MVKLGSLTAQNQMPPQLGFCISRLTSLIPGTLLVHSVADIKNVIYGIGWLTLADANKAQPINTARTPLF
jgi:hypothetical protein